MFPSAEHVNLAGLAFDEDSRILYANAIPFGGGTGSPSLLYTVNVTTGLATLVGANGQNDIDGLAWISDGPDDHRSIPEPLTATLGLMGLGVLGMATRRRVA